MKYKEKFRNRNQKKILHRLLFKTNFSFRVAVSVAEILLAYIHTIYKCVIKIYLKPMLPNTGTDITIINAFFWVHFLHEMNFNVEWQSKILSTNEKYTHISINNYFPRLKFNISQHTKMAKWGGIKGKSLILSWVIFLCLPFTNISFPIIHSYTAKITTKNIYS